MGPMLRSSRLDVPTRCSLLETSRGNSCGNGSWRRSKNYSGRNWPRTSSGIEPWAVEEGDMRRVAPWILSKSLPDALEQITTLRARVKNASTYDGVPLTTQTRATFMAMLDETELEEVANAREREEERLGR